MLGSRRLIWADGERRTGFVHFVNEADQIVTQHLEQRFVDLRRGRLAADVIAEFPLHRGVQFAIGGQTLDSSVERSINIIDERSLSDTRSTSARPPPRVRVTATPRHT